MWKNIKRRIQFVCGIKFSPVFDYTPVGHLIVYPLVRICCVATPHPFSGDNLNYCYVSNSRFHVIRTPADPSLPNVSRATKLSQKLEPYAPISNLNLVENLNGFLTAFTVVLTRLYFLPQFLWNPPGVILLAKSTG